MRFISWFGVLFMVLMSPLAAQERAMIVLDASGSMWGQIEGKTKIEIARDTLGEVLGAVPEANELGLMVYGHRRKGDCNDIELAVPAGKGTSGAITAFANGISPKGKTPLSAAVKQAAQALRFTEDRATVILVTDGLETCEMDPCALGRELEASGVNFTAHVVGFGLSKEEGAQVACLAEETGGQYMEASSADALGEALQQTVVVAAPEPEPEPEPQQEPEPMKPEYNLTATATLAGGGPVLADKGMAWSLYPVEANGKVGKKREARDYDPTFQVSVPAGDYEVHFKIGRVEARRQVTLSDEEETTLQVVLNAGIINAVARRTPEGNIEKGIRIRVINGDIVDSGYGEGRWYMPAGEIEVRGTLAKAVSSQNVVLLPGEELDVEVIVGAGIVVASALYADDGPEVETGGIRYLVYEAKTDLKGNRKAVGSTYGSKPIELPVGEYVVAARLEKAEVLSEPIKVESGARTDVQLVLNAGVAAISAPGGHRIRLLGKKNLQGERKLIASANGDDMSLTLPAGKYLARVTYESDTAPVEAEIEITAGERNEVTLK